MSDEAKNKLDAWAVDEGDADYELMKNLYASAKRKAGKIQQRLAQIREEIRQSTRDYSHLLHCSNTARF